MLLQHPGTENVHSFTPGLQWISSIAAFFALYSLPVTCISRATAISQPKNVNHGVSSLLAAECLRDHAWGHPSTGTATSKLLAAFPVL